MVSTIDCFLALGFAPDAGGPGVVWRLPSRNRSVELSVTRGVSLEYGWPACVTLCGVVPTGKKGLRLVSQDLPPECADGQAFRAMLGYALGMPVDELLRLAREGR